MESAKHLQLLKPDIREQFGENGRMEVRYLQLGDASGAELLEQDVAAGATLFRECLKLVHKPDTRVVLLEAESEEEGLLAVSYLAHAWGLVCMRDSGDSSFSDEKSVYQNEARDSDDICMGAVCRQEEWMSRIPLIPLEQVRYENTGDMFTPSGPVLLFGASAPRTEAPYWTNFRKESVCIVSDALAGDCFGVEDVDLFRRFADNEHIFLLQIRREDSAKPEPLWDFMCATGESWEEFVCQILLCYTAEYICIGGSEQQRQVYWEQLFVNWAASQELELESEFPVHEIVAKIADIRLTNKSELMEKSLRYARKDGCADGILRKEDFQYFSLFRSIASKPTNALKRMDKMLVGMESVKEQVRALIAVMEYKRKRKELGLRESGYHNVHLMIGAPGTAKTTMAKLMADAMFERGLLPGNQFISLNGSELKGQFVGHTAPKVKHLFQSYDAIFIDEAYSLTDTSISGPDCYAKEALAQLMIEIEAHATDKLILFAGYGGEDVRSGDNLMKAFVNANPGLRSRINSTIYFASYTPDEMVDIVFAQARERDLIIADSSRWKIRDYFAWRCEDVSFGNGREARSFVETCMVYAALRTMDLSGASADSDAFAARADANAFQQITDEDVSRAIEKLRKEHRQQEGRRNCVGF